MTIFKKKISVPKLGQGLKDFEITFFARVFEYYKQEGDFDIKIGRDLNLYVRFYSAAAMADLILVPDHIKGFEKDGAQFVRSGEVFDKVSGLTGSKYFKKLEEYRI